MEQHPKYESWHETEQMLRRTRDLRMRVTLARVECLEKLEDQPSDRQSTQSES